MTTYCAPDKTVAAMFAVVEQQLTEAADEMATALGALEPYLGLMQDHQRLAYQRLGGLTARIEARVAEAKTAQKGCFR